MSEELKPCPFCGAHAETDFIPDKCSYAIECYSIGCAARIIKETEQDAVDAWSRRAIPAGYALEPVDPTDEQVNSIADALRGFSHHPAGEELEYQTDARYLLSVLLSEAPAPSQKSEWLPTPENINALPQGIRQYICGLETNCDPSGMVRHNTILKDQIAGLQCMYRNAVDSSQQKREPIEWQTDPGNGLTQYVNDARYEKFSPSIQKFYRPYEVEKRAPLSEEEIFNIYCQSDSVMDTCTTNLTRFARAIEKHHGIT